MCASPQWESSLSARDGRLLRHGRLLDADRLRIPKRSTGAFAQLSFLFFSFLSSPDGTPDEWSVTSERSTINLSSYSNRQTPSELRESVLSVNLGSSDQDELHAYRVFVCLEASTLFLKHYILCIQCTIPDIRITHTI